MATVKTEETELKQNRHQFLLDYQKLKQNVIDDRVSQDPSIMKVEDHERLLQTAYHERNNLRQEFQHTHQELQGQVAEKESLQMKLQKLYETLRHNIDDKAGVDGLFHEIMGAEPQPNVIANEEDLQERS